MTDEAILEREARKASEGKLPVMEVFGPTMQGEGWLAGQRSYFIRLGGCSYRCRWCDSMHAVEPELVHKNAVWIEPCNIVQRLWEISRFMGPITCPWVTLSGGDPAMWEGVERLIDQLHTSGYSVAMETQGAVYRDWMAKLDLITVSPKPPSSGMAYHFKAEVVEQILELQAWAPMTTVVSKIVIFDQEDLMWAAEYACKYTGRHHRDLYLSAGTPPAERFPGDDINDVRKRVVQSYAHLVKKALTVPALKDAILLPQLHVLVWGHAKGV